MNEFVNFTTQNELNDLLVNAPNGTILVNSPLLQNRPFPSKLAVGSDFDGTGTNFLGGQQTSWQEVKRLERGLISQEGVAAMDNDYDRWGKDTSYEGQLAWADHTYKIYHDNGVTRNQLEQIGRSLKLRNGFVELASGIISRTGDLAVVTYGMDAVVRPCLEQTDQTIGLPSTYYSYGISLYAEQINFEETDIPESDHIISANGVIPNSSRVLGANKDEYMLDFARAKGLDSNSIVFLGDALVDLTAKSFGRGILIHHRESERYSPTPEEVFNQSEYILVGHSLTPLQSLFLDLLQEQATTIN